MIVEMSEFVKQMTKIECREWFDDDYYSYK